MFGRAPTQLTPVMDVEELAETLDIVPFQGATRTEIASRVRLRQEIVTKTMKRRWDTTNTIVCSSPQYIFFYYSLTSFKVFNIGDKVLCSQPKQRKRSRGPKIRGPLFSIPGVVIKVHISGNISVEDEATKVIIEVMSTEAKYVFLFISFYNC
jgi:hypothetical protein